MREKCFLHVVQKCFLPHRRAPRRKPLARPGWRARPGGRNGTPCGRERRPAAGTTACGRTPCGRDGNALAGEDRTPQSRAGPGLGRLVDRRQSCTAIKLVAGPAPACAILPLPMSRRLLPAPCSLLPSSCSLLWLLLWLLPGSGSAGAIRAARGPRHHAKRGWGKADMCRPFHGLRPGRSLGTHYASLRVCPAPMLARVCAAYGAFATCRRYPRASRAPPRSEPPTACRAGPPIAIAGTPVRG